MVVQRNLLQSTVVREPAKHIGEFSSDQYNRFHVSVVHDIGLLVEKLNALYNRNEDVLSTIRSETSFLKKRIIDLEKDIEYKLLRAARLGQTIDDWVDFHDTSRLSHPSSQPNNLKALIDSKYGQAILPIRALQNKFYVQSITTGSIVPPADLQVSVTSVFDKLDGNGLIDYEYGGTVVEGTPENAFNGINNSTWSRRVEFQLDSDVSEVEVELTVQVPDQSIAEANVLTIDPFPYREVDITGLFLASDLSSSFQTVTGFTEIKNASNKRYVFVPQTVSQVKIRLRQRNWFEENGRKVFIYGLGELGLQLVEWDRTYVSGGDLNQNTTFVVKFLPPTGYKFDALRSVNFDPNFLLEDVSKRHIHAVISSTPDFQGSIWNSDTNLLPQDSANGVSLGTIEQLYAIITLNFVDSTGGFNSPFAVGIPAYLNGVGIQYTVTD